MQPAQHRSEAAPSLGISLPESWWPRPAHLKSFEAAGFSIVQLHAPPIEVLSAPRLCVSHGTRVAEALATSGLRLVAHAPDALLLGTGPADRAFDGLLSWCAEVGAEQVVYHARALPDLPHSEERLVREAESLQAMARIAERREVTIALENLAPAYLGLAEKLSANPMALRGLVQRCGSERVGLCLDVGHAHIVAALRHTSIEHLIEPVLDLVTLFHLHDNLGARSTQRPAPGSAGADHDPLRLDLHLPPGEGSIEWDRIGPRLAEHGAPLLFEIHPPHRPSVGEMHAAASRALGLAPAAPAPAKPSRVTSPA